DTRQMLPATLDPPPTGGGIVVRFAAGLARDTQVVSGFKYDAVVPTNPPLAIVDVVADSPRAGQTLVVVGPGDATPAQPSSPGPRPAQPSSPGPKDSAEDTDHPGGPMASAVGSPTLGAGTGGTDLGQQPVRPGRTAAQRQDSGFHDGVSVPQPPGVVTAPT